MDTTVTILLMTSISVGFLHTITGPDHYIPFVMLGKAQNWSRKKLVFITFLCGIGHILSSIIIGIIAFYGGKTIESHISWVEEFRGSLAGWLLLGFGLAYALWGIKKLWRSQSHQHDHHHIDGTVHHHLHSHMGEHAHVHAEKKSSFWILMIIFILGPCEPMIPIILASAAKNIGLLNMILICGSFGAATIFTMIFLSYLLFVGFQMVKLNFLNRYMHVTAGSIIALSGGAILWMGL